MASQPLELHNHFQQLCAVLHEHADLWRPVPFSLPLLPWESKYPALAAALRALDTEQCTSLETDGDQLAHWLAGYLPRLAGIPALVSVAESTAAHTDYPSRFEHDIPGRKWRQVTAFVSAMAPPSGAVLEWCGGKAHLGRAVYQRFRTPVTALERNAELCTTGNALAKRHNLDVQLVQCDVMSSATDPHIRKAHHVVALHACGDLHRRLIETVCAHHVPGMDLSPCCYHLTAHANYKPFSRAAAHSGLTLSRDDCRLAVQETVTAAGNTTPRRHKKNAWRLGFDALQRTVRGVDEYLPVPPIPDSAFQRGFPTFCRHAARIKALDLPTVVDWPAFEQRGWERQAQVSRMELPRHAFRRVLELWLVLDRALLLSENGYRVNVGTFCNNQLTPRNLMISATR
jgi:hypothetical protein